MYVAVKQTVCSSYFTNQS